MKKPLNLAGQTFGLLTALHKAPHRKGVVTEWVCKCACGNTKIVRTVNLSTGVSTHCGCQGRNRRAAAKTTHGKSLTAEHNIWIGIGQRCNNPNDPNYGRYGGRGIKRSAEWDSFETFLRDMGPRPSRHHTVDRIDGTKGYSKVNCRWATPKEQARNMRTNRWVEIDGGKYIVADIPEHAFAIAGILRGTVYGRLHRGWSLDQALTVAKGLNKEGLPSVRKKREEPKPVYDFSIPFDF